MSTTPSPAGSPSSEVGPAAAGRCARCGYALAGLTSPTCPECGCPTDGSTLLRYADPAWVRMLGVAATLMRGGAIAALVFHFSPEFAVGTLRNLGFSPAGAPRGVVRFLEFGCLGLAVLGAWLLASPDPLLDDAVDEKAARRRLFFRIGLLAAFTLALVRAAAAPWLTPIPAIAVSSAACIIGFGALRRLGDVVRDLMARCASSDGEAAKKAGSGAWLNVIVIAVFVVAVIPLLSAWKGFSGTNLWTTLTAAASSGERVVIYFGLMGIAFTILSLAKPLAAVRAEAAMSRSLVSLRSGGGSPGESR